MYYTYCRILGVMPGSDVLTIKHAFRKKAKIYHPDLNPLPEANLEFIKIKKALDYLLRSSYTNESNSIYHQNANRNPFCQASEFDWEKYKHWQKSNLKYKKPIVDIDYKSTVLGKSVFYFFHLVFLFAGISIAAGPVLTVTSNGFDPEKSVLGSLVIICLASLFGIAMVIMILFSVLNRNIQNWLVMHLLNNKQKHYL